jgi:predicted transcriptional regulator
MEREKDISEYFRETKEITRRDINEYLRGKSITNKSTMQSIVNRWKQKGIIVSLRKGLYQINTGKKLYAPAMDNLQQDVANLFNKSFPDLKYCIWNTKLLNDLMIHQPFNSYYIFETELDVLDSVFFLFKDNGYNAFITPDENTINKYINGVDNAVIIKKLVTRAPIAQKNTIFYPTIEKILVDIFIDQPFFQFAQGTELANIYNESFHIFAVNLTRLLNYAERRKAKEGIVSFMRSNINNPDIISLL